MGSSRNPVVFRLTLKTQRAADAYDEIGRRMHEIRKERDAQPGHCWKGCGAKLGGQHIQGCGFSGTVTQSEARPEEKP